MQCLNGPFESCDVSQLHNYGHKYPMCLFGNSVKYPTPATNCTKGSNMTDRYQKQSISKAEIKQKAGNNDFTA